MEEIEKTLKSSFRGTANSLSQFYMQSLQLQKQSYLSGYQKSLEQIMEFAASKAMKTSDSKIVVPLEDLILFYTQQIQSLQSEALAASQNLTSPSTTQPQQVSLPQHLENTEMTQNGRLTTHPISENHLPAALQPYIIHHQPNDPPQSLPQHSQQHHHYVHHQQQQQPPPQQIQNQTLEGQEFINPGNSNFSVEFKEGSRKRPIGFTFEPPPCLLQNGLISYQNNEQQQQQQSPFPYFYNTEQVSKRGKFELPVSQQ